jgi:hypothetical protein
MPYLKKNQRKKNPHWRKKNTFSIRINPGRVIVVTSVKKKEED